MLGDEEFPTGVTQMDEIDISAVTQIDKWDISAFYSKGGGNIHSRRGCPIYERREKI